MFHKKAQCDVEIQVCKLLSTLPKMPNVVNIYDVRANTIVMEQLDVNYQNLSVADRSRVIYDLLQGLKQLNANGIYYADIKLGNIGWSTDDKCWKIFDFDIAGTMKGTMKGVTPDLSNMGYPDGILDHPSIEAIQSALLELMLPDIVNNELAKFILNPDPVYY